MARAKKEAALTPEERLQAALVPDWEWPHKLPENWCWLKLVESFDNHTDSKKKIKQKDYLAKGKLAVVDQGQELIGGYTNDVEKSYSGALPIVIFGDHTRCIKFADFPFAQGADGVKVLRPKPFYLPKAFYYALQSVNIPNLGYRRHFPLFNKFSIPLPPLAEQQRIVDRIESLFAKLDEAKEKAQAVLDSFETRKAAILHKAFTGELTAKWREEHGVGMDSWRWIPLKKSGSWCGGGTPSMSRSEYWENGTLLWVTAKDMKSDLIEDTLMHTNMFGVENSSANYIAQPAVLFVMRSGILRRTFPVCMVKKPFTVNQDIKALVPTDNIDLEYLFWGCKANEKRILESCMKNGTTVESINSAALRDFEIPIAGSNEQIEIVRILDAFFAKEQQTKEAAEIVLDQIELMKKSILARAFRGELGTNDPSEESAVELLKRGLEKK